MSGEAAQAAAANRSLKPGDDEETDAIQASPSSLPGLTRQSIPRARRRVFQRISRADATFSAPTLNMDHRVEPGGDEVQEAARIHISSLPRHDLNPLPAATRRAGGDIDAEVLDLLASALQGDQFELVVAVEVCGRTIEGQQRRHFGGEALLEIGGFQRAAPDGDAAVGGCDQEPDRRQGTSSAIGLDVGIDADAFVVAGRNLDLALGDVALRLRLREFEVSPIRSAAVAGNLAARLGSCTRIANVLYLKAAKGRRE